MSNITPQEVKQIAKEAYIYGLQQAVFYVARFVFTQLEAAPKYVGVNRLIFNYKPSGPDDREIVTPNATTLYGAGFFDLSEEPLIVELPEIVDRYYSFQAMDQYGDYFFYAGNQFTGREAQQFILVGPNWSGKIPAEFAGTHIINAPSATGFMIARIALKSYADAEVKAVNGYQDQIMARPLDGANNYVLHFAEGELPPVDGFWSLTVYDSQMFQVANPIDRFAIGDRDELAFNEDGSLSLYIQHESPGKDKESNWLPSPRSGRIIPIMRLYGPQQDAVLGRWDLPKWQRV
jgi:hypothetical protein